jgi:hypothetical protein
MKVTESRKADRPRGKLEIFRAQVAEYRGTSVAELMKYARLEYHTIQKRTPRRIPYVRSKYFVKDKIFLNTFWDHVNQKRVSDKIRRLRLFGCAIELIRKSPLAPETVQSPTNGNELLHRMYGVSTNSTVFCVQIKENKKTHRKDFISVFPIK